MILTGMIKHSQSLQCLHNISKKKLELKLIFCIQINIIWKFSTSWLQHFGYQSFLQDDAIIIDGHNQTFPKYKFAISLQYLKKVRNGVHFLHADKYQSFYKLALSFLMNLARHVQSAKNRKLVIFLRYIKKTLWQRLLCSIIMQNIQIFYGSPVIFVVTCFWVVVVKNGRSLLDHATLKSVIYISILNWWKELIFCMLI